VIAWGRSRDEFWRLHPAEFWWAVDAMRTKHALEADTQPSSKKGQQRRKSKLDKEELLQMKDELRHARVAAGYSPE